MPSLYIHIPFCRHICHYCDFPKVILNEAWAKEYMDELKKEFSPYGDLSFSTIYIGGGTPSALPPSELKKLLEFVAPHLEKGGEFSLEMNPEDASDEIFSLLSSYGVNRISMGLESASTRLLRLMGRKADIGEMGRAISLAKKWGISNLSADLIYGWPNETKEELEKDIDALLSLDIPHLSAYSLTISPGTVFYNQGYEEEEDDKAAEQYERILFRLREAGYRRYEVSNFAKAGHECRHNIVYWKDEEYLGIGLGAAGYFKGVRYKNTSSLGDYLRGVRRVEEEKVAPEDDKRYYLLTNLRLAEGFALKDYEGRFGISFLKEHEAEIGELVAQKLLNVNDGRIFCSDKGLLLLDRVLIALY